MLLIKNCIVILNRAACCGDPNWEDLSAMIGRPIIRFNATLGHTLVIRNSPISFGEDNKGREGSKTRTERVNTLSN